MSNAWTRKYNTKPLQINSTQIVNCTPCRAEPCLQQNSEALLKVYNRRMYNYVRVPSSLYMGTLGALNTFNGSRGGVYGLRWNQSSDKKLAHVGKAIVPSRGNSTRGSITRHRPGAGAPGGVGVDIKHNSFQRYLNRKKGATVPSGPYVGAQVNPKSVTNNKVQKSSIITTKNTIDCLCDVTECVFRETITLEQALAQGGVRDCQDLMITQPSTTSIENDTGNQQIESIAGLVIETGNTFTIAKTGKVTIATDIAATGDENAVGIFVKSNGKLINNGTITFEGAISGQTQLASGIFNVGSFEQSDGAITFKGAISGAISGGKSVTYGIDNVGSFEQSDGAITFKGAISGQSVTYGILNLGSSFQTNGAITFKDTISSSSSSDQSKATGIFNTGSSFQTNGAITFEGAISCQGEASGILNIGSFEQNDGAITFKNTISSKQNAAYGIFNNGLSFQTNGAIKFEGAISSGQTEAEAYGIFNNEGSFEQSGGAITFEGAISSQGTAYGIYNKGSGSFQTNGTIRFEDKTLNFFPEDATGITGTGTITYGTKPVNTYYPQKEKI